MTPPREDKNEDRRQALLATLRNSRLGALSAVQLSGWANDQATLAVVRRDLKNLEKRGLVVRGDRNFLGWRWRAL